MKPRRDKGRIAGPFVPLLKDTMKSGGLARHLTWRSVALCGA